MAASMMAESVCSKKVLVEFEDDAIPVSFVSGGEMGSDCKAVTEAAAIQLSVSAADLVLKMQSEEWGGRWINVCENDNIPDKAVLKAAVRKSVKVWFKIMLSLQINRLGIFKIIEESRNRN